MSQLLYRKIAINQALPIWRYVQEQLSIDMSLGRMGSKRGLANRQVWQHREIGRFELHDSGRRTEREPVVTME